MADYGYGGPGRHHSTVGEYGGRTMHSNTDDSYNGGGGYGRRTAYSETDGCYDSAGGYGAKNAYSAEYSSATAEYGGEQESERYRREEKEHKHRERMGELGALAGGAFALYEGHRAKKDPEHAQRHKIEQGVGAAAALGAGGYAFHEHHEQKVSEDERKGQRLRRPSRNYYN